MDWESRWISSGYGTRNAPPLDVLEYWIAESYGAVAPKRLSARPGTRGRAALSLKGRGD